ncbi:MAG: hypothetical protein NW218_22140 [Saprospiraceae bacterium]|nr:hypothetical protein [Saprospiraceae bacterium]
MITSKIYEEIAVFLAEAAPTQIMAYKPSADTQQRYDLLVARKKAGTLNREEISELEHYFMLEHIFRFAKIRAAMRLES